MNHSVAVSVSVTLSWNIAFTAQESSKDHKVTFKRYPQFDSSTEVEIGLIAIAHSLSSDAVIRSPLAPRIAIPRSTPITEPAITIRDVTEQDEAFYRIEVSIGGTEVAHHTLFLTVFGNYVHLACLFSCIPRGVLSYISYTTRHLTGCGQKLGIMRPYEGLLCGKISNVFGGAKWCTF